MSAGLDALEAAAWDDEAHRRVLADALLDLGDPRGEFIQIQLRLEEPGAETPALRQRERELLNRHGQAWLRPLADVVSRARGHAAFGFRRGFVEDVTLDAGIAADTLPRLLALAPLRRVTLRGPVREPLARVAGVAELARVAVLDLGGTFLDAKVLGQFLDAAGPRLRGLDTLILQRNLLGPKAAQALVAAGALGNLAVLDLRHNSLGLPGIEILARAGVLPGLRRIGLAHNQVFARLPQVQYDWGGAALGEVREEQEGAAELAIRFAHRADLEVF